jgi:hypothetical protein
MGRYGTDYHVARPTGICAATGQTLEPGSPCMATLCDRVEDEGFERLDYSMDTWATGARPPRLFSFWRTAVPEPGARTRLLVDDAVLMDLFERLADDARPQRIAFRFVLALILLRKKLLRFAGRSGGETAGAAARGGTEHWLFLPRGAPPGTPPIAVVNPQLSDDDVRELTEQLAEVLQSEL